MNDIVFEEGNKNDGEWSILYAFLKIIFENGIFFIEFRQVKWEKSESGSAKIFQNRLKYELNHLI